MLFRPLKLYDRTHAQLRALRLIGRPICHLYCTDAKGKQKSRTKFHMYEIVGHFEQKISSIDIPMKEMFVETKQCFNIRWAMNWNNKLLMQKDFFKSIPNRLAWDVAWCLRLLPQSEPSHCFTDNKYIYIILSKSRLWGLTQLIHP